MIRILALILAMSSVVSAEPFDCMVALTRQDASMDWWYAVPQGFTPQVSGARTFYKGEYFRIIPIFKNYALDSNQTARISFDVEVICPDGGIDTSILKCDGHNGSAASSTLLPAQGILNFCFDPSDPHGEYQINVSAVDHVSGSTNIQSQMVELKPFSIEDLSENERNELFFKYPTSPTPSRAFFAFLQTEHSFFNEENEPIWSAIWFFKTIFENNEYLIPHLLDQFSIGTPKQKRDIILILALMNQAEKLPRVSGELKALLQVAKSGRVPNPYDEIVSGKQLDMLWAEFFATGTVKPVRQIIGSLVLVEHLGTLEKIKAGELDPKELEVYRVGMLESVFQSALWSLKSNCRQCPLLFHYCVGILHSEDLEESVQRCLSLLLQSIDAESENETSKEDEK